MKKQEEIIVDLYATKKVLESDFEKLQTTNKQLNIDLKKTLKAKEYLENILAQESSNNQKQNKQIATITKTNAKLNSEKTELKKIIATHQKTISTLSVISHDMLTNTNIQKTSDLIEDNENRFWYCSSIIVNS